MGSSVQIQPPQNPYQEGKEFRLDVELSVMDIRKRILKTRTEINTIILGGRLLQLIDLSLLWYTSVRHLCVLSRNSIGLW